MFSVPERGTCPHLTRLTLVSAEQRLRKRRAGPEPTLDRQPQSCAAAAHARELRSLSGKASTKECQQTCHTMGPDRMPCTPANLYEPWTPNKWRRSCPPCRPHGAVQKQSARHALTRSDRGPWLWARTASEGPTSWVKPIALPRDR